ncbi:hypothetical protein [Tessaracoccus antarcticus]|uniref:hypothetical protein n=1 Tax=Tessaracoccus antarcticus TaxID=2479848 RepID=UPI0011C3ACBD|nr:hypothetical protein [Tessaracoccus antarcticus]
MEYPPQSPTPRSGTPTGCVSEDARAHFTLWERIPPTTPLGDLFATSLLVMADHEDDAVLVRCSPGVEEATAQLVNASASRPNALNVVVDDAETPIGAQSKSLLPGRAVTVVAIPHVTWMHPGAGLPWRMPITIVITLAAVLGVAVLHPPLSVVAALPVAAVVALLAWLLLRRREPTRIELSGGGGTCVADVVRTARSRIVAQTPTAPDLHTSEADTDVE